MFRATLPRMVSFWDHALLAGVFLLLNAGILYVVIKAAVKNALHEDRLFQAKVRKAGEAQPTR